jgi:antitoxin MazE
MKKQLHLQIRQIGNSRGVVIPKAILEQVGFEDEADLIIEGNKLVLSKPKKNPREGWAEASKAITEAVLVKANGDRIDLGIIAHNYSIFDLLKLKTKFLFNKKNKILYEAIKRISIIDEIKNRFKQA